MTLNYIIIFIFGLVMGSFLDCLVARWKTDESIVTTRSACPHCQHTLQVIDLIPVLSWVFLMGKCRYCKGRIPFSHLLTEIGTGLIFLAIYAWMPIVQVPFLLLMSCLLILIFLYDLKHSIVLDRIIYPAILLALGFAWWQGDILFALMSGAGAALFFFLLWFFSHGKAMGFGDVKIALMMGFLLGFPNIVVALFLAFTIGAIIGVGAIIAKKKGMKSEVPFGPFLVTGTLIALLFGSQIINFFMYEIHI